MNSLAVCRTNVVATNIGARYCLPGVKKARWRRGSAVPRYVLLSEGQRVVAPPARRVTPASDARLVTRLMALDVSQGAYIL